NQIPFQMQGMKIKPLYKKFDGWNTDITSIKKIDTIPSKMKTYISYINDTLTVPVNYISNGPGSDQIIVAS
ncbi:MAG: adenylosuccinate synthetase, partial [Ginsengibacter sp.]